MSRLTGLAGCVIMPSPWDYLIHSKKETDHENLRTTSHPGRHRRIPAASLVVGWHGCHRPVSGPLIKRKGGRRKPQSRHPIHR
ncbi:MAG: hypothetical protein J0L96_01285, partial [Anaerolineae bacterium]|nr:hypothetical protein [Anaerolineae bacterium]